jgi:hypothetical protein
MLNPNAARKEDEGLANAFTSFTVALGLGKYFSPDPADSGGPADQAGDPKYIDNTLPPL